MWGSSAAKPLGFGSSTPTFGQSAQSTSPGGFGKPGGFGATAGGFGAASSSPFQQKPAFGTAATGFGATSTPAFGGSTTPTSTLGGGFGAKSPTMGFGSTGTGAFGQAGTSAFGAQTPAPFGGGGGSTAFGGPGTGGFGVQQTSGAFGAPATGGFGSSTMGSFGAPSTTTPAFGTTQSTLSPFGTTPTSTTGAFGTTTSAFGTQPTGAFGTGSLGSGGFGTTPTTSTPSFGMGGTGAFGAPTQTQPAFGATGQQFGAATSPFGAPSTGVSAFGAPSTTGFGAPSTGFGAPSTGFGAPATGFGAPSSGFGGMGGGGAIGTGNPPFSVTETKDTLAKGGAPQTLHIQVITAMKAYENKSLEELRLEDYQKMGKAPGGSTPTQGATGAFGAPASTGMFGQQQAATPTAFGAPATGGFGTGTTGFGATSTTSAFGGGIKPFGATSTPSTQFGTTTTPGAFGAPTQGTTGFGAPSTTGFGTTPSTSGAFGATTTTTGGFGGFGATSTQGATTGFGAPSSGFGTSTSTPSLGFGASTTQATGAFGQQQTTGFGAFGSPNKSTVTFGGAPTTSTGGFGTTGAFGASTTPSTGFGGFGTSTSSGFGTTGGVTTGGFGAPSTTSAFGTTTPATGGFGGTTTGFGATGGGFGAKPTFGGFGTTPSTTAPTTGGFGGFGSGLGGTGTPSTGFGGFGSTTAGTTGFGTSGFGTQPLGGGFGTGFGQQQQVGQQGVGGIQSGQAINPNESQLSQLQSKMNFLDRKKDELEIYLKDDRLAIQAAQLPPTPNTVHIPKSTYESPARLTTSLLSSYRHTPRSTAKITPRSYMNYDISDSRPLGASMITKALTNSSTAAELGATTSFLKPEGLLTRSGKKLVIGPQFHKSIEIPLSLTNDVTSPPPAINSNDTNRSLLRSNNIDVTPVRNLTSSSSSAQDSAIAHSFNRSNVEENLATKVPSKTSAYTYNTTGDPTGLTPYSVRTPVESLSTGTRHTPMTATSNMEERSKVTSTYFEDIRASVNGSSVTKATNGTNGFMHSPVLVSTSESTTTTTTTLKSPEIPQKQVECPILTLEGYMTTPSMDTLRAMSSADELSRIQYFTISRPGYGMIEWQEPVDLNGLNLDKIVKIEKNTVMVYHEDDEDDDDREHLNKPPVGAGLNKPAIITLYNILPKDNKVSKILQFEKKLYNICEKTGATFLHYNPVTGTWVFRVEHFSKYGLEDDDDEEEGENVRVDKYNIGNTGHQNMKIIDNVTKQNTLQNQRQVVTPKKDELTTNNISKKRLMGPPKITNSAKKLVLKGKFSNIQVYSNNDTPMITTVSSTSSPYETILPVERRQQGITKSSLSITPLQYTTPQKSLLYESTPAMLSSTQQTRNQYTPSQSPLMNTQAMILHSTMSDKDKEKEKDNNRLCRNGRLCIDDMLIKKLLYDDSHPKSLHHIFTPMEIPLNTQLLDSLSTTYFQRNEALEVYNLYQPISIPPPHNISTTTTTTTIKRKQGLIDMYTACRTSFRVGWTPDGRIVHSGLPWSQSTVSKENKYIGSTDNTLYNIQQIRIESVYTPSKESVASAIVPLKLLLQHSVIASKMNIQAPVNNNTPSNLTNNNNTTQNHRKPSLSIEISDKEDYLRDEEGDENESMELTPCLELPTITTTNWNSYSRYMDFIHDLIQYYTTHSTTTGTNTNMVAKQVITLFEAAFSQEKWSQNDPYPMVDFMPFLELMTSSTNTTTTSGGTYDDMSSETTKQTEQRESNNYFRRREFISHWLQSLCLTQVRPYVSGIDEGSVKQSSDTYTRIYELLSCHRIYDAVKIAEKASLYRLATILSQLHSDESLTIVMREQLTYWVSNQVDSTIPDDLLAIYRLLSAMPTRLGPDNKVYETSTLSSLEWYRSIGIFYWYCQQTIQYEFNENGELIEDSMYTIEPMTSALLQYRLALLDHDVNFPDPTYASLTSTTSSLSINRESMKRPSDCIYNLLEVLFTYTTTTTTNSQEMSTTKNNMLIEGDLNNNDINDSYYDQLVVVSGDGDESSSNEGLSYLLAALESENNINSSLDYHISYIIMICLQASGHLPTHSLTTARTGVCTLKTTDKENTQEMNNKLISAVCIVRQHVITQLLASNEWKWALFIILTIPDSFQRHYLLHEVITRYLPLYATSQSNDMVVDDINSYEMKPYFKSSYVMLCEQLYIPDSWIYESLAYAYNSVDAHILKTMECYIHAGMYEEANDILGQIIAPALILVHAPSTQTNTQLDELYALLITLNQTYFDEYIEMLHTYIQDPTSAHQEIPLHITQGNMYIHHKSTILLTFLLLRKIILQLNMKSTISTADVISSTTTTTTSTSNSKISSSTFKVSLLPTSLELGENIVLSIDSTNDTDVIHIVHTITRLCQELYEHIQVMYSLESRSKMTSSLVFFDNTTTTTTTTSSDNVTCKQPSHYTLVCQYMNSYLLTIIKEFNTILSINTSNTTISTLSNTFTLLHHDADKNDFKHTCTYENHKMNRVFPDIQFTSLYEQCQQMIQESSENMTTTLKNNLLMMS